MMMVHFIMLTGICAYHGLSAHYIFCMSIGPYVRPSVIS